MLALSNKSTSLVKDALTSNNGEADKKSVVSGRRNNRADAMTKEEIMKSIGIVDPVIKDSIHESLSSIDYRAKSKVEVTNDVVVELEKQIDKLKYKRMKILEVLILICSHCLGRKISSSGSVFHKVKDIA